MNFDNYMCEKEYSKFTNNKKIYLFIIGSEMKECSSCKSAKEEFKKELNKIIDKLKISKKDFKDDDCINYTDCISHTSATVNGLLLTCTICFESNLPYFFEEGFQLVRKLTDKDKITI